MNRTDRAREIAEKQHAWICSCKVHDCPRVQRFSEIILQFSEEEAKPLENSLKRIRDRYQKLQQYSVKDWCIGALAMDDDAKVGLETYHKEETK